MKMKHVCKGGVGLEYRMCESVRKILIIIFEKNEKQLEIKSAWGRRDVERRGPVSRANGAVVVIFVVVVANVDDVVLLDTRRGADRI